MRTLASTIMASGALAGVLMMADETYFSLTDLAAFDTDSIETLTSRSYIAGIYDVVGKSVSLAQQESKKEGEPPLFIVKFAYEVLGCTPTDKKQVESAEKMVGRDVRDQYTIWPKDLIESLGLLKGRYSKAGIQNSGLPIGGVEGQEPGWLDMAIGAQFSLKVTTYRDAQNEIRNRFDWSKAAAEQTAIA